MSRNATVDAPDRGRRSRRVAAVLAAAALVLATPIVVWWLVGDLTTTPSEPDYLVHPPHIAAATETTIGLVNVGVWILALFVLVAASPRARPRAGWWGVLGLLVAVGVMAGLGERAVTMGVVGANIGGGLVLYGGTPLAFVLVGLAVILSCRLLWTGRSEPD